MARKSKRHLDECAGGGVASLDTLYPAAIYARLSMENSGKDDDGASIENQVDACREYVEEAEDLTLYRVYQDNGWSGTNMKRPAWEEMMEDVREGKVRAIVVRDLSRFGRNYLETGTYLEMVFPRLDVRFISVKESFDTFKTEGTAEALMVPLQNLINDLYSKDISRKVSASFKAKRQDGSYRAGSVPYGYRWNEERTAYVINEEQAGIVREIYILFLGGMGCQVIADELNRRGVASPRRAKSKNESVWGGRTVKEILMNPAYYGALAFGKTRTELYRNAPRRRLPRSEWTIVEGVHDAIVSKEDYEAACARLDESGADWRRRREDSHAELDQVRGLLKDKTYCGNCGRRIRYLRNAYKPGGAYGRYFCVNDDNHSWGRVKLENTVLRLIHEQIDMAFQFEGILVKHRNSSFFADSERRLRQEASAALGRLETAQRRRTRLYEDYVEGILDEGEYKDVRAVYEARVEKLDAEYAGAVKELDRFVSCFSSDNKWIRLFKGIEKSDRLTEEMVDCLIERVEIYENDVIRVVFKFQDVFEYTRDFFEKGGFLDE